MRCTCCDNVLFPSEIIWYEKTQMHDYLCLKCRREVWRDLYETGFPVEKMGMHLQGNEIPMDEEDEVNDTPTE